MNDSRIIGVFCGLCLVVAGCGKQSPSSAETANERHDHRLELPEDFRGEERLAGAAMSPMNGSYQPGAAGAVEKALEGFRTAHLEIVFDALPSSYQRDVNDLVQTFAQQVDPELWTRTVAVLERGNRVLKTKKSLLIPLFPPQVGEALSDTWDELTRSVDQIVDGRLGDIEQVRDMELREFLRMELSRTLRRLMMLSIVANPGVPSPLIELAQVQVDLVESTDTTARVRIMHPQQTGVEPTPFVNVEGKWIPLSLAENWPGGVARARQMIGLWAREAPSPEKEQYRNLLTVCEGVLDQMLVAETAEQLAAAATPLFQQATQVSRELTLPETPFPAGPPEGVSLLIQRELSEDEVTKLLDILEPLTDDPAREYHLATANGGKTYVSIKPVRDVAAFAAKLSFGKDVVIDETARTITLRDVEWK